MKTQTPESFGCETYLKSWALGFRSGSTLDHTLSCPFCRPLVHGGTEDCRLPVTEEVRLVKKNKKRSRRRFLATAALSTLALFGTSTAVRSFIQPASSTPLVVAINTQGSQFDTVYANSGGPGINLLLRASNDGRKKNILEWIHRRKHWPLLPLVIGSLSDPSEQVRLKALILLMDHTPRVALKPHLAQLDRSRSQTRDGDIRSYLANLIREVDQS